WVHLRTWKHRGYHFRRQAPRDGYILDFVCLTQRLIVEVDGGQHNLDRHASKDQERDRHFEAQGFNILRFWNSDVNANLRGVLAPFDAQLAPRGAPPRALRPAPPPTGEG